MSDVWLGFFGGIVAALIAALAASFVQRQNQEKTRKEEARHEVYMRLLDINQQYFWIASSELRGEKPPDDVVVSVRQACWQLVEKLRECDSVECLDDIMDFLFSTSITSSNERAKLLDHVLDGYGRLVNPKYTEKIKQISNENVIRMGTNQVKSHPPTSWRQ